MVGVLTPVRTETMALICRPLTVTLWSNGATRDQLLLSYHSNSPCRTCEPNHRETCYFPPLFGIAFAVLRRNLS